MGEFTLQFVFGPWLVSENLEIENIFIWFTETNTHIPPESKHITKIISVLLYLTATMTSNDFIHS